MKKYVLFFLAMVVLSGCGAAGGKTPAGSTAIFNPTDISIAGITTDPATIAPATINVTVKDSAGVAVFDTRLHFVFSFTALPSATAMNNNGLSLGTVVILEGGRSLLDEYVQNTNTAGSVLLNLRIAANAGLVYSGNLAVYDDAGLLLATAAITVTGN